jgi:long-chain acyl-CoA synthetase
LRQEIQERLQRGDSFSPDVCRAIYEKYYLDEIRTEVDGIQGAVREAVETVIGDLSSLDEDILRYTEVLDDCGKKFNSQLTQEDLMPLVATMLEPEYHTFEGPNAGKVRSAGRAGFNADVVIMDAEDVHVESGEVGEICVRGPMVMQGYWRQPELTREVLRGGWMHTGDAGYLDDDGFLFLVDRIKDMIITGGENVYSAAVENVIYQYAGVHECAVIGIPSEQWGEAVHAIVVMQEGAVLDTDRLVEHCREHLAGYECPKSIDVWDTELPKSGVGKILKAELRAAHWPDTPASGVTPNC